VRQLAEAPRARRHQSGCICADQRDIHAVVAGTHNPLQAVLLGELGLGLVVQHEAAALDGSDILVRVEAEGYEVAERADTFALPSAAERLSGVLVTRRLCFFAMAWKPVAVHGQAGEIDGDDGPGSRA